MTKRSKPRRPRSAKRAQETAPIPPVTTLRAARRAGIVAPADLARQTIVDGLLGLIDPKCDDVTKRDAAMSVAEGVSLLALASAQTLLEVRGLDGKVSS